MSSMGMDKSGTQSLPTNVWTKLTGFVVRAGYPATVITNSTLVMDAVATGNIQFRGTFSFASGTQQFRVVRNGTTVLGSVANSGVTGTVNGVSVVPGDTLELQGISSSGFAQVVNAGATQTWLAFDQTTSAMDIEASDVAFGLTATADTSVNRPVQGEAEFGLIATADMHVGEDFDIEGDTVDIGFTISASMSLVPRVATLPSAFSFVDVAVAVHTADGRNIGDFPCNLMANYRWGRESREVSGAEVQVHTQGAPDLVEALQHWAHWVTIWHDDNPVWTGPIQTIRINRSITSITARDPATFMWRTWVPITQTFIDTVPARIADPLWRAMYQLHDVRAAPLVLPGTVSSSFTINAVAGQKMLHQLMDDLAKIGLMWTVVAGRPVLGEFSRTPVTELFECDFTVDLERRRDGTNTYNEVRVQGQNWTDTQYVPLADLHLQTIVSMDDLAGSANIQRAAREYVRDTARLRDELVVPANASLNPSASVTMDDLIPGKVFLVHHENLSQLMRLDRVEVVGDQERFDVQVTLVALEPPRR